LHDWDVHLEEALLDGKINPDFAPSGFCGFKEKFWVNLLSNDRASDKPRHSEDRWLLPEQDNRH
jgi:hypothetical protein